MNLRGYRLKETHALFPVCVMEFDLSDSKSDIDALVKIIQTSESSQHEFVSNGTSSYHNRSNILDHPDLKSLKSTIELCIKDYCAKTGLDSISIANSWWNKIGKGGAVDYHRHRCSVISGAFYPLVDNSSSGLILNSPIDQYRMNEAYRTYNEFSAQHVILAAKQYHMYLFPSWLEHGVRDNQTDNRIVVSFNADRKIGVND